MNRQRQAELAIAQTLRHRRCMHCLQHEFQRFLIQQIEATGLAQTNLGKRPTDNRIYDYDDDSLPAPLASQWRIALETPRFAGEIQAVLAHAIWTYLVFRKCRSAGWQGRLHRHDSGPFAHGNPSCCGRPRK